MRTLIRGGVVALSIGAGFGGAAAQTQAPPSTGSPVPATPAPKPDTPPGIAATVNGEVVRLDQVDAFIKAKLSLTVLTADQLHQLRSDIATDMADDLLLRQFLRQHGPRIAPTEVDRHLGAFTRGLTRQGKTFAEFLRESGQTEAQIRETWTTLLQLSGYVREHVTQEQLKQYFVANKDHFDRVEVRVSHIVVRLGPTATRVERAAASQKLRGLRADVLAGRITFAAAARKHSQCPSGPQGGDLGYIVRKGMLPDEAFCRAAFALKVGELSDVVETETGCHLILATDRKPGTPTTYARCAEEVREAFTDDFRTELIARLRKQAQVRVTVP